MTPTQSDGSSDDDNTQSKELVWKRSNIFGGVIYSMQNNTNMSDNVMTEWNLEIYLPGTSLLSKLHQIFRFNRYAGEIPLFEELRRRLVMEYRDKLAKENLFFQSANDTLTFKQGFINNMKEDPEYTNMFTGKELKRLQTHDSVLLNISEDIEKYLQNKLQPDVELTELDAVQFAIMFTKDVIMYRRSPHGDNTVYVHDNLRHVHNCRCDAWAFTYDVDNHVFINNMIPWTNDNNSLLKEGKIATKVDLTTYNQAKLEK
jgi:hypothetical protein